MRTKWGLALLFAVGLLLISSQSVQALLGDLDFSGLVDRADMAIIRAAYGSHSYTPISPNWDPRADINLDGKVNLQDLALVGRSFGDTFNFHSLRRISNGTDNNPALTSIAEMDAVMDAGGTIHVIWVENKISNEPLYYSKIDKKGNALIEDILIDNDAIDSRLAVDSTGNIHIVWRRHFSASGAYYSRLNSLGQTVVPPICFCNGTNCGALSVAADRFGNAHILYVGNGTNLTYTILDTRGKAFLTSTRLNTNYGLANYAVDSTVVQIDLNGDRHFLWHQKIPGAPGYYVYTRIREDGSIAVNQLQAVTLEAAWNARRLFLQADSLSAAHLVYYDHRSGTTTGYYWRRINPDGSLSSEKKIVTGGYADAAMSLPFTLDAANTIHFIGEDAGSKQWYGLLDRDGNVLRPYQKLTFALSSQAMILVDAQGNGALVGVDNSSSPKPMVIQTTASDAGANDATRADLVLDSALTIDRSYGVADFHLQSADPVLRIGDPTPLNLKLINSGPAAAAGIIVTFQSSVTGLAIPPETVANLGSSKFVVINRTFSMPMVENITHLVLTVTATTTTPETTLGNNTITVDYEVVPPATTFNLDVTPFDESLTPNPADRPDAAPLDGATLTLRGPGNGLIQQINPGGVFNRFLKIPLDTSNPANVATGYLTSYTLTLSKAGFAAVSQAFSAHRSPTDPYRVLIDQPIPLVLYTNSWGTLEGNVHAGGLMLANASLTLDGVGTSILSDASGNITFGTKVPAGSHLVQVIEAGYQPIFEQPVTVSQGSTADLDVPMVGTTKGYVRGIVTNLYGMPLANATVRLYAGVVQVGTDQTTGDDGAYSFWGKFDVAPGNYSLNATRTNCENYASSSFTLQAGVPQDAPIDMTYVTTQGGLVKNGTITSWKQEESWMKSNDHKGLSIMQEILGLVSYATGIESFESYEVNTGWGTYDYSFWMDFSDNAGQRTVDLVDLTFKNKPFMAYETGGGGMALGAETETFSAERVDRIELVPLDNAGNVTGNALWTYSGQWYSSLTQEPDASLILPIPANLVPIPELHNYGLRIFLTVGQYDPNQADTSYYKGWMPPANGGNLSLMGSSSGANKQCFTWRLDNTLDHRYAMADYPSTPGMLSVSQTGPQAQPDQPAATPSVSMVIVQSDPVRVGVPFVAEIRVTGADAASIYGVEYDLTFNPALLQLVKVEGGGDLAGTDGAFLIDGPLAGVNSTGQILQWAAVRLSAGDGMTDGALIRLTFLPRLKTATAKLTLSNVSLSTLDAETFTPAMVDATYPIEAARIYLPILWH